MKMRKNARSAPLRREEMARRVIAGQTGHSEAATSFGVTAKTVPKRAGRFQALGPAGHADPLEAPPVARRVTPARAAPGDEELASAPATEARSLGLTGTLPAKQWQGAAGHPKRRRGRCRCGRWQTATGRPTAALIAGRFRGAGALPAAGGPAIPRRRPATRPCVGPCPAPAAHVPSPCPERGLASSRRSGPGPESWRCHDAASLAFGIRAGHRMKTSEGRRPGHPAPERGDPLRARGRNSVGKRRSGCGACPSRARGEAGAARSRWLPCGPGALEARPADQARRSPRSRRTPSPAHGRVPVTDVEWR